MMLEIRMPGGQDSTSRTESKTRTRAEEQRGEEKKTLCLLHRRFTRGKHGAGTRLVVMLQEIRRKLVGDVKVFDAWASYGKACRSRPLRPWHGHMGAAEPPPPLRHG